MAILVTGSSGFIGNNCVNALYKKETIGVDLLGPANSKKFYSIDIRNEKQIGKLFLDEEIDAVVHLAGISNYHQCEQTPELAMETNVQGTLNILKNCKKVETFVLASTAMVYGTGTKEILTEECPPAPQNVYATTKLLAEKYCEEYATKYGFEFIALRATSVYGVGMRKELAIRKFIEQAISGKKITVYGDGAQTRNFLYVTDLCDAISAALCKKNKGKSGQYNIGGPDNVSVNTIIALLKKTGFPNLQTECLPNPRGDVYLQSISLKKIGAELAFNPKIGIEQGIRKSINWITGMNTNYENH